MLAWKVTVHPHAQDKRIFLYVISLVYFLLGGIFIFLFCLAHAWHGENEKPKLSITKVCC